MIPEIIEENKNKFINLLSSVNREGITKLLSWLEKTDFYIAPSSCKYHNNCKGGLCDHSLNVYNIANKIIENIYPLSKHFNNESINKESLIISALCHDFCKINFYTTTQKWYKDNMNQWKQYTAYEIDDKFPIGHGEKSCIVLREFIKLTGSEYLAIRWHMAQSDEAVHFSVYERPAYQKALEKEPLVSIISQADYFASMLIEKTYDLKIEEN